jgi:hypothetical protein
VWKGKLTINAGVPSWTWAPFVNGLPEASVHDLSIFHDGQIRLLRAAVASRGVWEVDLLTPGHAPRTVLRVHPHDSRRRAASILTDPTRHNAVYRWDASPDVRVRRTATVPKASPPGEVDLLELHGDPGGIRTGNAVFPSAHSLPRGNLSVDVLVHHRDPREQAPNQVPVLLLWREFPRIAAPLTSAKRQTQEQAWAALAPDFGPAVTALFGACVGHDATDAPAMAAQAALNLPNWKVAKPTGTAPGVVLGQPNAPLDARTPRSVTFDITTTGTANSYIVFVALAASALDGLNLPNVARLQDLVLQSPHVASTTIHLT